jgi:hypothetical protein
MTLRKEMEEYLGISKPARVRQSYPMINSETPTHWRKTLKLWVIVVLVYMVLAFVGGIAVGIIGRVWP